MKDREFSFSPEKKEYADEFHTGAGEFHRTIGKSRAGRREPYGGAEEFYNGAGEFHDVPDEHTTYGTGDEADDKIYNDGRREDTADVAGSRHKNIKKMMLAPIATVAATVSIVFSSYNVDPLGSNFLYANESGYEETLPSEGDKPDKPDKPSTKPDKTKDIRVGDVVYFGSYEQDNDTSNGTEQIEWRVLDVKDGNALLLSMYGLDAVMYHSEDYDITWDECSLRNVWMDNFYKTAFTKSERKAIVPTKLRGEGESAEDTTDNVFALSVYDIENYFGWGGGADCKKYATPYAKANGVFTDGDGACNWWLRSPGFMGIWAANVEFDGSVNDTGSYVMFHDYAACPAVWVDIKSGVLVLKERGEGGQGPSTAETKPQETEETSRWQWPTKETEPEETTQGANMDNFPNLPNMEPLITGEEFIRLEAPADDPEAVRYILNGGSWGWYDDNDNFHAATVERVKGISYDDRTNTLTLNNYTGGGILNINQMGNGFTLEVKGDNYIDVLEIWGWFYGGSVTITGKGTLTLNKDMEYNMGIAMWAEQSQTCLRVDDEVTLDVYGSAEAIWIEQTLMSEAIYYRSGKTFVDGVQGDINCYTDVMDEQSYAGEPLYICTVSDNYGTGFATRVTFAPKKYDMSSDTRPSTQETTAAEETTSQRETPDYYGGIQNHVMDWKDDNLEAAMRRITGIYDGPIMLSDVGELTELYLRSKKIKDISALAEMTNLTELYLSGNQINDVSGLSTLINLTNLDLRSNEISDVSGLSTLTNLTYLFLSDNKISDVSGLSTLTDLTNLDLRSNKISDVSGLSTLINLTNLDLSSNEISDVSGLSTLTNLTKLFLVGNKISDVSGLSTLTNLTELYLDGNSLIHNRISDVSGLSTLTNLTTLHLSHNEISDVSGLSTLTNLTYLNLAYNEISDVSGLSTLTNLTYLDLASNEISDVSALAALTNLTDLNLKSNEISDYSPVEYVPNVSR